MIVPVFAANRKLAEEKISEGQILTIAKDDKRLFVEYIPSSGGKPEVIIFQRDEHKICVWHKCPAEKSNYKKGCWHLGLCMVLFGINDSKMEVELISPPDQYWAKEDLTPAFLSEQGKFQTLLLKPEGGEPPVEIMPESSIPGEAKFLEKYHLPKKLFEKILDFRNRQQDRLTAEQQSRIPRNVNYIPQGSEVTYAAAALLYDTWSPPLFMGPAGAGKSTLAEALAEILHLPLRRISGGIDVNAEYLLGGKTLAPIEEASDQLTAKVALAAAKAGSPLSSEEFAIIQQKLKSSSMKVVHEPGVLLQAVTDGEMILVDEVNVLIPEVTSILHSLLDWQKTITVSGVGEVKAHPDFRLVAAMNVGYMGTRPLNKAFRDRFRGIQINGISRDTLLNLLQQYVDVKISVKLADVYQALYEAVYSPVGATLTESCISLRSLLRAAEEYSMGIGSLQDITVSCLTESIESESERTQVKDLVELKL